MNDSNWQIILNILTDQLKSDVHRIKSEDPVLFCLKDRGIRDVLQRFMNEFMDYKDKGPKVKLTAISVTKREEGNRNFKMKNFGDSLSLYTKSIFHAPKNSDCLPLAFANRSSVLFHLNLPEECLQDIDMATSNGYPNYDIVKLLLRKGKCLIKLNRLPEAEGVLTDALLHVEERCKNNQDIYKKELQEEIDRIQDLKKQDNKFNRNDETLPELKNGGNEDFANASKAIGVVYTKAKGRHVIAKEDIQLGDVLFVERPFAFVVLTQVCHECCTSSMAPIPCWHCLDVQYCSPKCRDLSWDSVHKFECGFYALFKSVGIAHLGLRVVLQAAHNFKHLLEILEEVKPLQSFQEKNFVTYKDEGYENVYNLEAHLSDMESENLFQYSLTAALLTMYVQQHTDYFSQSDSDRHVLGTLMLRHIAQLVCNGHAITHLAPSVEDEEQSVATFIQERIGTAIYPSASMMNHSCDPSIINSFYKNYLIVRACKPIQKGDEVFNCYGPHCKRMSRSDRQEILLEQYFFRCECLPCSQAYDLQDKLQAFCCSKCSGPLVLVPQKLSKENKSRKTKDKKDNFLEKPNNTQQRICIECGTRETVSNLILNKECEVNQLLKQGEFHLSEKKDVNQALNNFLESWRLGKEVLYKHHHNLVYAADQVNKTLHGPDGYGYIVCSLSLFNV